MCPVAFPDRAESCLRHCRGRWRGVISLGFGADDKRITDAIDFHVQAERGSADDDDDDDDDGTAGRLVPAG